MKITLPILVSPIIILLSGVFGAGLFAQNNVEYLTIEDGLSQGFISEIIQDKEGFIWFGTRNGLNRYDGYQFEVFTHNPVDSFSIQGNITRGIIEMDDYLLVGTSGTSLNVFHKKTKRFFPVIAEGMLKDSIENGRMPNPVLDKNGFIWTQINFAREKSILAKFKIEFFEDKPAIIKTGELWDIPYIKRIYYDEERDLITGINHEVQIFQLDIKTGKVEYFDFPKSYLQDDFHMRFSNGWFYHQLGLGRLEKEGWRWHETDFKINRLLFDSEKELINISVLPGELLQYEIPPISTKNLYHENGLLICKIKQKGINSLFTDKSKVLWIGMPGYGIGKLKPNLRPFKTLVEKESIKHPVFIDHKGRYSFFSNFKWIDSPSGHSLENFANRENHRVYFKYDSKNTEWASIQLEKEVRVYRKKPPNSTFEWVFSVPYRRLEINNYHILNFDNSGNVILAFTDSFFKYDIQTKEIQRTNFQKYLQVTHRVNDLVETADGTTWIATDKGLIRILSIGENADVKIFKSEKLNKNSLLNSNISSLLVDPKNADLLWIGTMGGGLSRLNIQTLNFTHFNTRNGFPNDVIYSVLSDKNGQLWLSSNKGIIHFDPETKVIKNYTTKDGLPSNEFNFRAYGQGADGTIYFGGVNGVISFHPDEISDNLVTPPVRITNLEINDQKIVFGDSTGILSQTIEFEEAIELSYFQNDITLEFAGLEYFAPSKNQFQYYLEGVETAWKHRTTDNRVNYLNLSPGNYTFHVKASNSDGIWHPEPTVLKIKILPPWWLTNWAFFGYFLLLLGIGYGLVQFFLYRQKLKHRITLKHQEAERLKELNAFKNRLYTNITHEFRTPLTVILGMAEELVDGRRLTADGMTGKKEIGLIKENGKRLLNLINQMLDLAKLEEKSMPLNLESEDVILFLKYLTNSFEQLAQQRGIQLYFNSNLASLEIDFDKKHLQTIVSNLLSNALKFTSADGEVFVKVGTKVSDIFDVSDTLKIEVRDTGQGIPQNQLKDIFNRFYQIENFESHTPHGTGIGLTLTKELVHLMNGEISVESEENKGTTFTIALPILNPKPQIIEQSTENRQPITDNSKPTLLLIEDDKSVLEYLKICTAEHYQILLANDGQQGIDLALETVPDLIVSDVMMPRKTGFEVVETLKKDERTSHIPIILLTAKADDISKIEGLESGADAYLFKPFNKSELLVRLRKLLELRKKLQDKYARLTLGNPLPSAEPNLEDNFIKKVQSAIFDNLDDENFGIPELCKTLGVSRTQLHNKLKALTGKSTSIYIRLLRLQKAREFLLSTDHNVSEIAVQTGFRYLQNFSKFYKETFGETPGQTRKK